MVASCSSRAPADRADRAELRSPKQPPTGPLLLALARAGARLVAVGEGGQIRLSDDSGRSWRRVDSPVTTTLTGLHFQSAQHGWAVGHETTVLQTSDAGNSWRVAHREPNPERSVPLFALRFIDSQRGLAVGAYGTILSSADGGRRWTAEMLEVAEERHLYALTSSADGALWIAGEGGGLYHSVDDGDSWQAIDASLTATLFGALPLPAGGLLLFGFGGLVAEQRDATSPAAVLRKTGHPSLLGGALAAGGSALLVGSRGVILRATRRQAAGPVTLAALKGVPRGTWTDLLLLDDDALVLVGDQGARRLCLANGQGVRECSAGGAKR